jgi:hypothetical protein
MPIRFVAIGLFALLLCHALAQCIVGVVDWWQAEHDLSERLTVYRSTDSLIEFQIALATPTDGRALAHTTEDGFRYRSHDYSVVSLDVRNDTLFITGLETGRQSFWPADLLTFLDKHISAAADHTDHKGHSLLKLLLKEYSPGNYLALPCPESRRMASVRIPEPVVGYPSRSLTVQYLPPESFV